MDLLNWTSWQYHTNSTGRGLTQTPEHTLSWQYWTSTPYLQVAIPVTSSELRPWPGTDVPTIGSGHQNIRANSSGSLYDSLTALSPTSCSARHKSSSRLWPPSSPLEKPFCCPYSTARRWQTLTRAALQQPATRTCPRSAGYPSTTEWESSVWTPAPAFLKCHATLSSFETEFTP